MIMALLVIAASVELAGNKNRATQSVDPKIRESKIDSAVSRLPYADIVAKPVAVRLNTPEEKRDK